MTFIGVNEQGHRVGQDHHRARLTDAEVDKLLELREEGLSYRALALAFDISKSAARSIVKGRTRAQSPARWKRCT